MDKLLTNVDWNQMLEATGETLYMTAIAALATFVLGLILGLLLFMTAKDNLWENKSINTVIGAFVNIWTYDVRRTIIYVFIRDDTTQAYCTSLNIARHVHEAEGR